MRLIQVWGTAIALGCAGLAGSVTRAQLADPSTGEVEVPPPPPSADTTPPGAVPPAAAPGEVPRDVVLTPMVSAAESDLAQGNAALALARGQAAAANLPEGSAMRIRADGVSVLAQQRLATVPTPPAPSIDEVWWPLVWMAETEIAQGNMVVARTRLELALANLPEGAALRPRAIAAMQATLAAPTVTPSAGGPYYAPPPPQQPMAQQMAPEPRDPAQRGTGEQIELYVTTGLFGALTGAWLPFVASEGTAGTYVYTLTILGGAALFATAALALDLTVNPVSGVGPTISAGTRFGFANGMFAWMLYQSLTTSADPSVAFTLVWAGAAAGLGLGAAIGFGLEPEVREERFIEASGIWGGLLALSVAFLTEFEDATLTGAVGLAGLNVGWLTGLAIIAGGAEIGLGRTMFMSLGAIGGFGVGLLVPLLAYSITDDPVEALPFGVGSLIGMAGGFAVMTAVTHGWDSEDGSRDPQEPTVNVSAAPVSDASNGITGGVVTAYGAF
ncbi:MAG: hypothetical protein AB7S26_21415 [Sandaracinaceae bacterium]